MFGVLASEWLKLRSVRSTYLILLVLAAVVLVAMALAWGWAHVWDGVPPERRGNFARTSVEQPLLPFVQLCLAVLGVLAVTSEYGTGMIRTSLTVVPRRGAFLAAKTAVTGAVALVTGPAVVFALYFASRAIIGDRPLPGYAVPVSEKIPELLAAGLVMVVVVLTGAGLGVLLRSPALALVTVVALLFAAPMLARFLPAPWNDRATALMPSPGTSSRPALADQLAHAAAGHFLTPPVALAVLLAYAVVPLTAAALVFRRRDA